jgi:hypothetical protein
MILPQLGGLLKPALAGSPGQTFEPEKLQDKALLNQKLKPEKK